MLALLDFVREIGLYFKNTFYIYAFIWDMYLNYKLVETLCHSVILGNSVLELCLKQFLWSFPCTFPYH